MKIKMNKNYMISGFLDDGRPVELVYDKSENKTLLAYLENGQVVYRESLTIGRKKFYPYPVNELISKGVISLPSEAEDYENEEILIKELEEYIHKYVDLDESFERLSVYYVLFTWLHDKFNELPYLRVLGDYGSGKSRYLMVVGSVCFRGMFTGGATTVSPVFRVIDGFGGTLVLDEADYRFSDTTSEIIKILNSGYQKNSPVLRAEGQGKFEVKVYKVYGPKLIATRKRFEDMALESRCLTEQLEKKRLRDDILFNLPDSFEEEARRLRNKLLLWRLKNYQKVKLRYEDVDRKIEPRLNQVIMPLLSVIEDEKVKENIKSLIEKQNDELKSEREMSLEAEILRAVIKGLEDQEEPTIKQVAEILNEGQDEADKLTPRRIGAIIRKSLNLKAKRTRDGFIVQKNEANLKKIELLKEKYGVSEDVNVVNLVSEQSGQSVNPDIIGF